MLLVKTLTGSLVAASVAGTETTILAFGAHDMGTKPLHISTGGYVYASLQTKLQVCVATIIIIIDRGCCDDKSRCACDVLFQSHCRPVASVAMQDFNKK